MNRSVRDYLNLLEQADLLAAPIPATLDLNTPITLVSYDSRNVIPGTLFICKGAHFKPEFLSMARDKGAVAYVSLTPYPQVELPCILVKDMRRTMAPLADLYYDHPSRKLQVIGITGTKGKSTTAYYLKFILDAFQKVEKKNPSGIVSSIWTDDGVESFESLMTTPEPLDLQRHFANAVNSGMEYLTMEVSSQALKYHRSLCTHFAATCFLNLGHDHISPVEHPNFEDYFQSKLKIFAQGDLSCVNLDCDHAQEVLAAAQNAGKPVYTFSQKDKEADVYASRVVKDGESIRFTVRTHRYEREFVLNMPGLFNVENALGAIAVCEGLRIPQQHIFDGLAQAHVPGRMEVYTSNDHAITAIVDYAHNQMSFDTLFRSVKAEYPDRRVVCVFGCPGSKALDRRASMGGIAGRNADFIYITEDHSAEEDTLSICREIAGHVATQGGDYTIELNRGEAIRQAILTCTQPTILLVAGKGVESSQKRGTEYVQTPSDVEYVKAFLEEYNATHKVVSAL